MKKIDSFTDYQNKICSALSNFDYSPVEKLCDIFFEVWTKNLQIFLCGNGGSAGNANHLANDLLYGVSKKTGKGLRAISLSSNASILTCLANDVGYESIFAEQIAVYGKPGDLLILLSGSGNSQNIINAAKQAKRKGLTTAAILGFTGGACKELVDISIHFNINDMQISEDLQLIVGHMIMQNLFARSKS